MKKFLGEFSRSSWRPDSAGRRRLAPGPEELRIASEHLSDVTAELRQNLCT